MFNNPFLKKDPLLEAVKSAQAEGEMRRAAEAIVNEEFGVYSRNAVIREQLAAYDAALEEVFTSLKEGNKENKEKKKEHEEKTGIEHIKKMGGFPGQSLKRTARSLVKEGKPLTPAQDKELDVHDDDKIDGKDFAILRARKKNVKEGAMDPKDSDATPASKTISKGPYEDPSTPKVPYSELPKPGNRAGEVIDSAKPRGGLKEAVKKEYDDKDQSEHGVYKGKKKLGYVVKDKKSGTHTAYHGPSGGDYENVDDFPSKRKAVKQVKQSANLYKNMEESAAGKILSKIRAKYMEESAIPPLPPRRPANLTPAKPVGGRSSSARSSRPGVVSKADLDTYRKNVGNANATLGQYMNDLKGKTAVKGGANDPSVIQNKMNADSLKKGPVMPGKAFDPTTSTGEYGGPKSTGSTPPAPKAPVTPVEPGGSSNPPTTSGDVTSYAKPSVDNQRSMATTQDAGTPKPSARLQRIGESVEVGDNKYRIV